MSDESRPLICNEIRADIDHKIYTVIYQVVVRYMECRNRNMNKVREVRKKKEYAKLDTLVP